MDSLFPVCPPLKLYAVVSHVDWVARLIHHPEQSRVGAIQLREKTLAGNALQQAINHATAMARAKNIPLFINDHWQQAMKADAYGVHLGQEDLSQMSNDEIHQLQQSGMRLGISTHSPEELHRALSFHPSYIAIGAIFATTTKAMPTAPQGLDNLRNLLSIVQRYRAQKLANQDIRTVAIGGIFAENIRAVIDSGVDGVAVVRAISESPHPSQTIAELNQAFNHRNQLESR